MFNINIVDRLIFYVYNILYGASAALVAHGYPAGLVALGATGIVLLFISSDLFTYEEDYL